MSETTGAAVVNHFTRVDLGAGTTKQPGFIGVDRFPMPGIDVIADLDRPLPFPDSSVDLVYASHALEHVKDLMTTMREIYRICKHGAEVCIIAPYSAQALNLVNPYHKQPFNEHTPRFWTHRPASKVDPIEYEHPQTGSHWGLSQSDNSDPGLDLYCAKMEFFYFPEYLHCSHEKRRDARHKYTNVCDQVMYHLLVIKETTTEAELETALQGITYYEPPYISVRRATERTQIAQGQLHDVQQKKQYLEAELAAVRNQAQQLTHQLASVHEHSQQIEADLVFTRQQSEQTTSELSMARKYSAELETDLVATQQQFEQVTNELAVAREHSDKLEAELATIHQQLEQITNELAVTCEYSDQLEAELATTHQRFEQVTNELAVAREYSDRLETEVSTTQWQLEQMGDELAVTRSHTDQLEIKLTIAQQQFEQTAHELTVAHEYTGELETELSATQQQFEQAANDLATAHNELAAAHEYSAQLEIELGAIRQQVDHLATDLQIVTEQATHNQILWQAEKWRADAQEAKLNKVRGQVKFLLPLLRKLRSWRQTTSWVFGNRTNAIDSIPTTLQQLRDDSFMFNGKILRGYRLQASADFSLLQFTAYPLHIGRANLSAIILSPILDVPLKHGIWGIEIISPDNEIVRQGSAPINAATSDMPFQIDFEPISNSDQDGFRLHIYVRNVAGPVKVWEWQRRRLIRPGRVSRRPFCGFHFSETSE